MRYNRSLFMAGLLACVISACGAQNAPPDAQAPTASATAPQATIAPIPTAALINEPPPAAPTATPIAPTSAPAAAAAPTALPAPEVQLIASLLKRHDDPPPHVAEQFDRGVGEWDFGCQSVPEGSNLQISLSDGDHYEIGQGFSICLSGGTNTEPSNVTIEYPDGTAQFREIHSSASDQDIRTWDWVAAPAFPSGTYTIVAVQGEQEARASFSLSAATQPHVLAFFGNDASLLNTGLASMPLHIVLAGYQPKQRVTLHIYAIADPKTCPSSMLACQEYRTSLPVDVDTSGAAVVQMATNLDDTGDFQLVSDPPTVNDDSFRTFAVGRDAHLDGQLLETGKQAVVWPFIEPELWTSMDGDTRVDEHPRLYGGELVTVLALGDGVVQVRTEEGSEGWLHSYGPQVLTAYLDVQGQRMLFPPHSRVRISHANGIPLRAEPRSDASKLAEKLAAGSEATVQELRGNWLSITLDDGTSGWARWYYDGSTYIEPATN